jgi:hypothetical protein
MAYGGAQTEIYSEVLAQVCLAFSIVNGKEMTPGDLNKDTIHTLKSYVITQSNANLSNKKFIEDLIEFGNHPISKGFTWVDGQGKAMLEVKKKFKLNRSYKIYNDKLYGNTPSNMNPYSAFLKAKTGAKTDKWNPADMWVMNREGIKALHEMNRKIRGRSKVSLGYANQFLADEFSNRNIIPVSLKKPQKTPHIDIVNSNEYVTRLSLDKTRNPTIEYTTGNKDVKINFTIETVQLPKGTKASTARRNPNNINGKVVKGSEKHIRIKYHVDNKKVELEYTQSGYSSQAAAKMGNLGAANFQNIINKTSKQGVHKLNDIQKKYSDIDIKTNPWFNGKQLGVVKARKEEMKLEPHYLKLADYVRDIWEAIDGSAPDFKSDMKGELNKASGLWSKARAGELGVAVGSISNEKIKRRVIQNLFEAAASISYVTGLNKEEQAMEQLLEPSQRQVSFNAGVYVKVY